MKHFYVLVFVSIFGLFQDLRAEESNVGGSSTRDLGIITATLNRTCCKSV